MLSGSRCGGWIRGADVGGSVAEIGGTMSGRGMALGGWLGLAVPAVGVGTGQGRGRGSRGSRGRGWILGNASHRVATTGISG